MHLGSLESTQEARVALRCASSNSYVSFVLSKLPACIHNSIYYIDKSVLLGTKPLADQVPYATSCGTRVVYFPYVSVVSFIDIKFVS